MRITAIDNQTLNGPEGLTCRYLGGHGPVAINTSERQRAGLHPVVDSFSQGQRQATLQVYKAAGVSMHPYDLNELVHEIFYPPLGLRTLTMEYDGDLYTTECYVTSLEMPDDTLGVRWLVNIDIPSGLWHAAEPTTATESPVTVTGNVPALPKLSITGGEPVTRQRVTITDRTGHGVSAYLVSVAPSEDLDETNYRIWANGLEIPFAYVDGLLYFRVDAPPPPERVFVDVYMGASITNTVYAGALDPAGTELDAGLASGEVATDPNAAISNPLAPSLAWHPAITVPHAQRRAYTFGLSGTDIELLSQDAAGERANLPDDADSYVVVTGSEAIRIRDLSLSVFAGYQKSINETRRTSGSRRMRVRIAARNQFGAANDDEHYVQWQFGDLVYPSTALVTNALGEEIWHEVAHVQDFATRTAEAIGITPTQGAEGVFYLDFPASSFAGQDIPLITMQSAARSRPSQFEGDVNPPGDSAPIPAHLFQADWVDPATNEPYEDDPDTADLLPVPLRGQVRAVVKYRTRDSEHWVRAWSQVVTGRSPNGRTVEIGPLSVNTPGAVEIAVGLEPVASKPSVVDWGRLTVTSTPVIDLDTSKTPQAVVSAAIDALHIPLGRIRNATTGATITLVDYLADGGVDILTDELVIEGYEGVGPIYGALQTNRGAAMFQLMPGDNTIEVTGDIDTEDLSIEFKNRLAV